MSFAPSRSAKLANFPEGGWKWSVRIDSSTKIASSVTWFDVSGSKKPVFRSWEKKRPGPVSLGALAFASSDDAEEERRLVVEAALFSGTGIDRVGDGAFPDRRRERVGVVGAVRLRALGRVLVREWNERGAGPEILEAELLAELGDGANGAVEPDESEEAVHVRAAGRVLGRPAHDDRALARELLLGVERLRVDREADPVERDRLVRALRVPLPRPGLRLVELGAERRRAAPQGQARRRERLRHGSSEPRDGAHELEAIRLGGLEVGGALPPSSFWRFSKRVRASELTPIGTPSRIEIGADAVVEASLALLEGHAAISRVVGQLFGNGLEVEASTERELGGGEGQLSES